MSSRVLDFRRPHLLRDDREYDTAVENLESLLDRGRLSRPEEEKLEFLTLLVEAYERAHHEITETSTPQSVLDFLLEQNDMRRADLAAIMGGASRVSDFFNGRRALSLGQIQRVQDRFGVSADLLLEHTERVHNARVSEPRPRYGRERLRSGGEPRARSGRRKTK